MSKATPEQIAWAAGLFEGEGCFSTNSTPFTLTARLNSTDEDIIRRFHAIVGVGRVTERSRMPSWKPHWKPQWVWGADAENAVAVGLLLRPYFGERRRARFDELHQRRSDAIALATALRQCDYCGEDFRRRVGKGGFHSQRFCSARCRSAADAQRRREERAA